ncbi:MAG: hypothetical protein WA159_20820 [Variovorax sp.]
MIDFSQMKAYFRNDSSIDFSVASRLMATAIFDVRAAVRDSGGICDDASKVAYEWIARSKGVLSFQECCERCFPASDWKRVRDAILQNDVVALDAIWTRLSATTASMQSLPDARTASPSAECISDGRLALALRQLLQTE